MIRERIGILGGGQLGKMLCLDGLRWDLPLSVMDKSRDFPAAKVCTDFVCGDFTDFEDVMAFGQDLDIITIEIESVNAEALLALQSLGKKIYPSAQALMVIKDKGLQKLFYHQYEIPTAPFQLYEGKKDILTHLESGQLKLPFVQKLRQGGYDGRGVEVIANQGGMDRLFDAPSVVENTVEIEKEIGVIAARNELGELAVYDPVEMIFNPQANLVEYLYCPAEISDHLRLQAVHLAKKIITELNVIGLLAVEFFVDKGGHLLVNEVAPRPHNSGHHTIEACYTSQFQQHLRAISGMPLGNTKLRQPALMMNILGQPGYIGKAKYEGIKTILSIPDVYVHLYGKPDTKPFRKMGHITILGEGKDQLIRQAEFIKQNLKVIA